MADTYFSWTVPFPESQLPIDLAPADMSLPDIIGEVMAWPGVLTTASRKDWLNGGLVNTFKAFGGDALAFLVQDPQTLPGDRASGFQPVGRREDVVYQNRWLITYLAPDRVRAALMEVDAWLRTAADYPERFVKPLATDCVDQIAKELKLAMDLRVEGAPRDDGDEPIYFFSFLKSLRALLLDAESSAMGVLHVRFVYLFQILTNASES